MMDIANMPKDCDHVNRIDVRRLADDLLARGFRVFPLQLDKTPYKGTRGCHDATRDPEVLARMLADHPDCQTLGIATGDGWFGFDVDGEAGRASLVDLEAKHGPLPATLKVKTVRQGGHHLYFRCCAEIKNSASKIGEGLDIRGRGGYLVAPGSFASYVDKETGEVIEGFYEIEEDPGIAELPADAWLPRLTAADPHPRLNFDNHPVGSCDKKVPRGGRNVAMASFLGGMRRAGADYETLLVAAKVHNERAFDPPLDARELETIARSICRYDPEPAGEPAPCKDEGGGLLADATDAVRERFPELRLNRLTDAIEGGVSVADVRLYLEGYLGKLPRTDVATHAMELAAKRGAYDPLTDHIEGLPEWDGVERLGDWLVKYAGAEKSDYTCGVGRKWLIGAIARALVPGCKMDTVLVLRSGQGASKTSAFEILGGAYYKSNLSVSDLHGKEARQEIRGSWMIEMPELNTLRRSDIDATKGFLSEGSDTYRPSYGRSVITVPRRCVFCGTANMNRPFISDDEVQRRFWVVTMKQVNKVALRRDRDQLLAEARQAFRSGEEWWFDDYGNEEFRAALAEAQEECRMVDSWEEMIAKELGERTATELAELKVSDVLEWLHVPAAQRTRAAEMRVAKALGVLGWKKAGRFSEDGKRSYKWVLAQS